MSVFWSGSSAAFGVLESVALSHGLQYVAAVGEAIEGGAGEMFAAGTAGDH